MTDSNRYLAIIHELRAAASALEAAADCMAEGRAYHQEHARAVIGQAAEGVGRAERKVLRLIEARHAAMQAKG